jgi:hypothetical protein
MTSSPRAEEITIRVKDGSETLVSGFTAGLYHARISYSDGTDAFSNLFGSMRVDRRTSTKAAFSFDLYDIGTTAVTDPREVFPRANARWHAASLASQPDEFDPLVTKFRSRAESGEIRVWCRPFVVSTGSLALTGKAPTELVFTADASEKFTVRGFKGSAQILSGTVDRVSDVIRSTTIRHILHPSSERAVQADGALTWTRLFQDVGWEVKETFEELKAPHRSQPSWTNAELLELVSSYAADDDVDRAWTAIVFCVPHLVDTERGVMFDFGSPTSNRVPRQACAIASHWMIPNTALWKEAKDQRFGAVPALYFRSAVHEVLHIFGLGHPSTFEELSFRQPTDVLIDHVDKVPSGLPRSFGPHETVHLRHTSDVLIRPGGLTPEHTASEDRQAVRHSKLVDIAVTARCEEFPLGAPIRIRAVMENRGRRGVRVPTKTSLLSERVEISVVSPDDQTHVIRGNIACDSGHSSRVLRPGEKIEGCFTIFSGSRGPIFTQPGDYRVTVTVIGGGDLVIQGSTTVRVAWNEGADRRFARRVAKSWETQLLLVTGDTFRPRVHRMMAAVLKDPLLRPHYEYLEARRLLTGFFDRSPNISRMSKFLRSSTVLTAQEVLRLAELLDHASARPHAAWQSARRVTRMLRAFMKTLDMLPQTKRRIRSSLDRVARRIEQARRK